jgi:hypothetical protein
MDLFSGEGGWGGVSGVNSNDSIVEGLVSFAYSYSMVHSTLTYTVPVHLRNKFTDPDAHDRKVRGAELDSKLLQSS